MTEAELWLDRALTPWPINLHNGLVRTSQGWRIAERICNQTVVIGSLPPGYAIPQ